MNRVYSLKIEDHGAGTLGTWQFIQPSRWQFIKGNEIILFMRDLDTGAQYGLSAGYLDELPYIHASVSREKAMPTYEDLCRLKEAVFGADRYAAMVFPPASFHVNIHKHCLHLWGPIDPKEWLLPEFGELGTI